MCLCTSDYSFMDVYAFLFIVACVVNVAFYVSINVFCVLVISFLLLFQKLGKHL